MEKMRQWMILTTLGVVGVMAAGWFLLVSPQRSHANELRGEASTVEQTTNDLRSQIAQLKQQQKGETAQQRELEKIAAQIPDNPQLPTLIRELSGAAKDAGVSLDSLAPSAPTSVATGASTGTAGAATAPLAQIQVTISVTGSYFNVESFMRSLEHLDRALKTTGLTLAPASSDGSDADAANAPDALTGQIQALIFESPVVLPPTATTPSAAQTQPAPAAAATAPATAPSASTTTPAQSAGSEQ
jgi:Tfp pilus assembly protein PilO